MLTAFNIVSIDLVYILDAIGSNYIRDTVSKMSSRKSGWTAAVIVSSRLLLLLAQRVEI